jgi:hypothetical protein
VLSFTVILALGVPALPQGRVNTPPDISGEWLLDGREDLGAVGGVQPNPDDYLGVPFNDAGRMRSDTTAESIWGLPQYQCRPHSAPHTWRGLGGARILKELDPLDRSIRAYHVQFWRSLDRPIFMDGRPHPPAWAPHSWSGFSTGEWIGNTLKVVTTHLKDGFMRRGGPQTSDMLTLTEYITRHDDMLTIVMVIDDPLYLDEPMVNSTTYVYTTTSAVVLETCNAGTFAESGGTDPHFVPHLLPDRGLFIDEWLANEDWIPREPIRGGVKTIYPEYRTVLDGSATVDGLDVPSSSSPIPANDRVAAQAPQDGQVHVLPVQGNIHMIMADGRNLAASIGDDGMLLVNTGPAHMSDQILEIINRLNTERAAAKPNQCFGMSCLQTPSGWSSPYFDAVIASPAPPRPLRYIFNTNAAPHNVGGNAVMSLAGEGEDGPARITAHENALFAMSGPLDDPWTTSPDAWPAETFYSDIHKLTAYFNGEGVVAYTEPAATTDGDSIIHFRQSEVIVAGDVYSTVSYPRFDMERGGSVQGVIAALNHIIDLAVPEYRSQGGTWVIPGRGRLSDTADVTSYRNMVQIVVDRIQDLIDRGMTLDQIQAERPTLDFDPRYGAVDGDWTTEMFVESVYRSLTEL